MPNKCGRCSKSDWSSSKRRIERKTMTDSAIVTRGLKKQFGKKAAVEGLEKSFVEYVSPYLAGGE